MIRKTSAGPRRIGRTAVVVGASMAGLCAARVAAERFDHVIVVDRDALPEAAAARPHVPQGRQPHLLLVSGARLLEGWFPGIVEELLDRGAVDLDLCADFRWHQAGGVLRRPTSDLRGPAMSRPLLEQVMRRRVADLPHVDVRGGTPIVGLTVDASGSRVTGVRLQDGGALAADLVVDATGRSAHSLAWLGELGFEPPRTSVVRVDTRYVSRAYRRTDSPDRDWKAAAVIDDPVTRRLAMALPTEKGWLVVLAGLGGESPPVPEEERLAYARSLSSPVIADLMACSEPLGQPAVHRFPANQRRHVERMRRFPLGWILLGDAVCSFDPIYGQGMTSAALQARALGTCLDRTGAVDRAFARRYFAAAGRAVTAPWSIAVGGDFDYPDTRGPKPFGTDLVNRYLARATVAAQHDDTVAVRLNEVLALVRRPEWLFSPGFVLRVLRAGPHSNGGGPAGTQIRTLSTVESPGHVPGRLQATPAPAQRHLRGRRHPEHTPPPGR
jgi:2-polyprenyl-6-methoxyphenol hydroxylase-like FAD-dependent oxidoreductase